MAQTASVFYSGNSQAIDHTPAAAVTAGDVVVQNGLLAFAKRDITAEKLGALHVGGVWKVPLESGHGALEVGDDLYFDDDCDPDGVTAGEGCFTTTDTGVYAGKLVPRPEADAGDNAADADDETGYLLHIAAPEGNTESS